MVHVLPGQRPGIGVAVILAAIGGLAVGGLTLAMQANLPGVLNHLGNSAAVWCLAAFMAGRLLPVRGWSAALAGTLVLAGAVVGYYACTTLLLQDDLNAGTMFFPGVWLTAAVLAGPVFGVAGAATRTGDRLRRALGIAALAAVFFAEAGYLLAVVRQPPEAALMAGLGVLVPVVPLAARLVRLRSTVE
jgi:hypothetical protein